MSHNATPRNGTPPQSVQMPSNRATEKTRTLHRPCDRCRSQHLKCVYDSDICQRCKRSGHECIRSKKGLRFRGVPASKFQHRRTSRSSSSYVPPVTTQAPVTNPSSVSEVHHQSHESSTHPVSDDNDESTLQDSNSLISNLNGHISLGSPEYNAVGEDELDVAVTEKQDLRPPQSEEGQILHSPYSARPTLAGLSDDNASLATYQGLTPLTHTLSSDRISTASFYDSPYKWMVQASASRYLDGIVKPMTVQTPNPHRYLETVLLRYFHDELAPWFDLCDPDCHFATVVLQRAREQGPLRNALLTISARNLARNKRFRNSAGVVQWNDNLLPELTEDFAVPYHNECIRDLLQLSMNPKNLHDETLLAAIIALRTDEEMGHDVREDGEDQQLFLKIASVFIDAQVPPMIALPHSSPTVFPSADANVAGRMERDVPTSPVVHSAEPSPSNQTDPDLGASGLRQACFWTQFRQELHASFLKQQPVRFPLMRCDAFRQLMPAIDAVWANRMVTFCADVLEFCYGSESSDGKVAPAYTSRDRWDELRAHERSLCALLPTSFEPTHCSEPNAALGSGFPEIWYLDPCHVSGTTYIELARMLLEVFNPTRPQLGHGFLAATNAFIVSTKKILFRLCGIALSNRHCAPSLINACIGISIFGEYFGEAEEQDALLRVLSLMTERHAYPTRQIALSLKHAWRRDDIALDTQFLPASRSLVESA